MPVRSGHAFAYHEMVPSEKRYICVRFDPHTMGTTFSWTLNHEMLLSFVLQESQLEK